MERERGWLFRPAEVLAVCMDDSERGIMVCSRYGYDAINSNGGIAVCSPEANISYGRVEHQEETGLTPTMPKQYRHTRRSPIPGVGG